MTSRTNTVKYHTDPDNCPYAKSDNTGCTAMVMWRCGWDGTGSMGLPLELRDKDKDGFPLMHDCRKNRPLLSAVLVCMLSTSFASSLTPVRRSLKMSGDTSGK